MITNIVQRPEFFDDYVQSLAKPEFKNTPVKGCAHHQKKKTSILLLALDITMRGVLAHCTRYLKNGTSIHAFLPAIHREWTQGSPLKAVNLTLDYLLALRRYRCAPSPSTLFELLERPVVCILFASNKQVSAPSLSLSFALFCLYPSGRTCCLRRVLISFFTRDTSPCPARGT